eukprot:TRINITY_DN30176_c0_g1_i1.p1 TRINITY_DN30176_c0_g1~~TRINITY_DN30176_c0_g1_i1.p1  ORF type:complete len:100 (-),score=11.45 TRINITY_DN30176_c0_g1_i1:36-335(-)
MEAESLKPTAICKAVASLSSPTASRSALHCSNTCNHSILPFCTERTRRFATSSLPVFVRSSCVVIFAISSFCSSVMHSSGIIGIVALKTVLAMATETTR